MSTDLTENVFSIQGEIQRLEAERQAIQKQLDPLYTKRTQLKEAAFLAEYAQLCNKHGMRIHGSSDREGNVDLWVDSLGGGTAHANNVLESVQ